MDDGSVMSAQTPTEYTLGIIDAGDKEPWFIDKDTVEHLKGGALKSAGWTRTPGSATGVVKVLCNNTDIVNGDIGLDITHADGDSGVLLDVKGTGTGSILWIRPDSNAAANNFDSTSGTLTCNAHTATQEAASETGESLWANVFSLGSIEANTHVYVQQNGALLTAYKGTSDWWGDGHFDVLVNVKEAQVGSDEVDEGVIKVFAREHSKTYDFFEVDLTSGGRNPIPLSTADDLDNEPGYRQMVLTTAAGGPFVVGEIIRDDSDSTIEGIVTSVSGTNPNVTLQYYLMGDPLNDFSSGTGGFTGVTSTATATAVNPTDVNAASYTNVTVTHGSNETFDVDENDTTENYSIVVDCANRSLSQVQQRLKFITRRGETTTGSTDGEQGQFYLGSQWRIIYTTLTGTINEGDVVTQVSTLATGTVVAHNTTDKILILRTARGTFNSTNNVEKDGSNYVTGPTSTAINPVKATPFGTFAGGKFFGAPGVVLSNVPTADATNYQLIDDNGNVVVPPNKVTLSVGNTRALDRIAVFRLTGAGGDIKKDTYAATVHAIGDATLIVGSTINTDEPGKTAGGVLRLVDVSAGNEYRIRYSSWAGSTFTLANVDIASADAGTNTTTIVEAGAFASSKVGDLVLNKTRSNAVSYVTSVDSANQVTISPAIAGQTTADAIELNAVPVVTTGSDTVYVPLIDAHETTGTQGSPGSEEATLTFVSNIPVRIRARQAGDILPYEADSTVTSTGMSNNVIRTADTIFA